MWPADPLCALHVLEANPKKQRQGYGHQGAFIKAVPHLLFSGT